MRSWRGQSQCETQNECYDRELYTIEGKVIFLSQLKDMKPVIHPDVFGFFVQRLKVDEGGLPVGTGSHFAILTL